MSVASAPAGEGFGLALFGKKKEEEGAEAEAAIDTQEAPDHQPEKARKFFDHAKTVHEATNYEYAMQSWLRGISFDPSSMQGLEGFFGSAAAFLGSNPKGKISKETARTFSAAKTPGEKFAGALLAAGVKPSDPLTSMKASEIAIKLELHEQAYTLAERGLAVALAQPASKQKKDVFVKLMNLCQKFGAYDLACKAGDAAIRLDPSDGALSTEVRNMSARATMNEGGFEQSGQAGGFRDRIRNSDKQRQLEEADRIVKTEDVKDRLVNAAAAEHQERPGDIPTVKKYIKALLDRAKPEDEKLALTIANKAYEETSQFTFRQTAGEITLRMARRALSRYRDQADKNPDDAKAQDDFAKAKRKFVEMEIDLLKQQVEAYPTDLGYKYELGRRHFEIENFEEAIAFFQEAKDDAKHRGSALSLLAQSFERIGWNDEAIQTYRHALDVHADHNSDLGMALRYGLMSALQAKASQERDLASAEEAEKLASDIAIQKISYMDIRDRRQQLKSLIGELRG